MSDLMFVSQNISNRTGHPVEVLTAAALIYFAIAFPITRAVTVLERRILNHLAI
jgi:polar amino acid transport system permease protein